MTRTGDDGFPGILPGVKGPSSAARLSWTSAVQEKGGRALPVASQKGTCTQSEGMRRCVDGKPRFVNVEVVRLSTGRPGPGGLDVSNLSVYSLDKKFLERLATGSDLHAVERMAAGECRLTRMNYLHDYSYPDPEGFDMGLKEVSISAAEEEKILAFPLLSAFRDLPLPSFGHKEFVEWGGKSKLMRVRGIAADQEKSFETTIRGMGPFDLRTDTAWVPGRDFRLGLGGDIQPDTISVSLGGFNTTNDQGYHVVCPFAGAGCSLVIPKEITRRLPLAEVPQTDLNISVEPSRSVLLDRFNDKDLMVRVVSSHRMAVTVPIRRN